MTKYLFGITSKKKQKKKGKQIIDFQMELVCLRVHITLSKNT